jgi:serpin B
MDDLSLLELPYEGDRLSMVLLLPAKVDGLAALEKSLNQKNLDRWLGRLREEVVHVNIPRFKLGTRFNLSKTLVKMGMPDAFTCGKADFSGMDGGRQLYVGPVIHQANVDVNEEGTEAAAATAVVMKLRSRPTTFRADHPFLFLIRDRQTGSILFMGRVADPSA